MVEKVKHKLKTLVILAAALIVVPSQELHATENMVEPADSKEQEIVSVEMPTVNEDEESPFDFILDPQGLMFDTDAMLYGGGSVEEGANLLFHNKNEAEYDFSGCSDRLTVVNCSTVPVLITITATVSEAEEITLMPDRNFSDNRECNIYLALIDDEGNEQPLSKEGEVSVSVEMRRAPENVGESEDIDLDTYSFGLTGECNVNGAWENITVSPRVTITWQVEPILSGEPAEEPNRESVPEEAVDENVPSEKTAGEGVKPEETVDINVLPEETTDESIKPEKNTDINVLPEGSTNEGVEPEESKDVNVETEDHADEKASQEENADTNALPEEKAGGTGIEDSGTKETAMDETVPDETSGGNVIER